MAQPHALLVGRDSERSRLLELVKGGPGERSGLVLVAGEAGIGKTRLIEETLLAAGRPALRGVSTPGSTSPYAAVVQVMRAYARDHRDALVALPLTDHLALLLPELGLARSETDAPTLRAAICDVAAAAGGAGSIWILEDLHWADDGTLDVLLELAEVPARSGLSILGTYRNDELPRLHRLRNVRSELKRAARLHEIVLQPLSRLETARLAEEVAGVSLSNTIRQTIFDRSDGIPFFVEEMAASMVLTSDADHAKHGGRVDDLPETLRDAIRLRTSSLDAAELDVLEVMAAAGISIDLPLLAELTDPDSATRLIERGWLIGVSGGTASFRHALVRDAIYTDIPWLRRRERHRLLAEALEARGAAPEQIARQWLGAREMLRARVHLVRAARSFCSVHAYRDARALLDEALREWAADANDAERVAVVELLARCAELSGDRDEAIGLWRETWVAREKLDDAEGLARAQRRLATLLELRGDWDEAVSTRVAAAEGFDACAQPADAAVERLAAAAHLSTARDLDGALDLVKVARKDAEIAGEQELKLRAVAFEGELRARMGEADGVTMIRDALSVALSKEYTGSAAEIYFRLSDALENSAEYDGALDALETAIALYDSVGDQTADVCLACTTPLMRHLGRYKEATEVCRQVMHDPDTPEVARNVAAGELGLISAIKGNISTARRLLPSALSFARSIELFPLSVECSWGLAMIEALEGKSEEASATASRLIERCSQRDEWHYSLPPMRWSSTWFAERGNEPALLAAVGVLSTAASRTGSSEARAALGHGLVEVALLNGDKEQAFVQAEETLKLLDSLAAPYEVAAMRARCAMALVAAGRRDAAIGILTAAYRSAKKLGARPLAESVVQCFEALGEPIEPHLGRRAGERAERGGLSRRELDVLRYVADGCTNKEIAEVLFLSTRTVDMHVRNVLLKLNCRSRAEAVRRAGELELLPLADPTNTA